VPKEAKDIEFFKEQVKSFAKLSVFEIIDTIKKTSDKKWIGRPVKSENFKGQVWIAFDKNMDFDRILSRLKKTLKSKENFIQGAEKKLGNKNFVDRAPEDVIAKEKQKLTDSKWEVERLTDLIKELKK
jgi:valyl-tRNA synthetase